MDVSALPKMLHAQGASGTPAPLLNEPAALQRAYSASRLEQYVRHGHNLVHGWLAPIDARIVEALGKIQTASNIRGSVGEIGVHHGRLSILLYLLLHRGERGFCIDVFGRQDLNPEGSGSGDLMRFLLNLQFAGIDRTMIDVFERSSEAVTADEIVTAAGKARLFSVDGSHTAEMTYKDLLLAEACLAERGIVVLDDFFNPHWPGVAEGACRFFADRDLLPFAISINKVFLCRRRDRAIYVDQINAACDRYRTKHHGFFGYDIPVFGDAMPRGIGDFLPRTVRRYWEWYRARLYWVIFKAQVSD